MTKAGASVKWSPTEDTSQPYVNSNKLIIRQILLGHEAKKNEYNVVEVETLTQSGESIKIPIAVLKVGETRIVVPDLEFPDDPVTFKLIEGSGPVYIHGQHLITLEEVDSDGESNDDYDDNETDL